MNETQHKQDAERLAEWIAYVPTAKAWLESNLGVQLDNSSQSLVPLWTRAMTRVARPPDDGTADDDLPTWARWPDTRHFGRQFSGATVHLLGALAAYYGQLLMAICSPPPLSWHILRHPQENLVEEGQFILARSAVDHYGVPEGWVSPHRDLLILGSAQLTEPIFPGEEIVGKDDPQGLLNVLKLRQKDMG